MREIEEARRAVTSHGAVGWLRVGTREWSGEKLVPDLRIIRLAARARGQPDPSVDWFQLAVGQLSGLTRESEFGCKLLRSDPKTLGFREG